MVFFSRKPKTDPIEQGVLTLEDEILAYMDELFRRRISLTVKHGKQFEECTIFYVDERNMVIRIQGDFRNAQAGQPIQAGFPLDRTWFMFKSKFAILEDKLHIQVPTSIRRAERRKSPRTTFSPREIVKVTILEGLGSGNGVFGTANDISLGGLNMSIEKAMRLNDEKEIPPTPGLFKPGTKLVMVRINKLPGSPKIEVQGTAARVYKDGKWKLALAFDKLSSTNAQIIKKFVAPRIIEFKLIRRSKKKRDELAAQRDETGVMVGSQSDDNGSGSAASEKPAATKPPAAENAVETAAPTPKAAEKTEERTAEKPPASDGPPRAKNANRVKTLLVGEEICDELPFLTPDDGLFEVTKGSTPVAVVRQITELEPQFLICGTVFKGHSSLEFLEKIAPMGVLEKVQVVICGDDFAPKDQIKMKMMKVDKVLPLPIHDSLQLLKMLNDPAYGQKG